MPLLEMVMENETQIDSSGEFDVQEISPITKAECNEALAVLVRGMRDNPIHVLNGSGSMG